MLTFTKKLNLFYTAIHIIDVKKNFKWRLDTTCIKNIIVKNHQPEKMHI